MRPFSIGLVFLTIIIALTSVFVVREGERAIVVRFGKVVESEGVPTVYAPGLHFKFTFFDTVRKLDAKIQTLDESADRFVTSEQEDLIVNSYVKWKIENFETFFLSTGGDKTRAESLLQQRVNNGLRSEFGKRTIQQIVSGERDELMSSALNQAAEGSGELGIRIVDVRVKQINLPEEISNSIFNRMRAARHSVAREYRSEGKEQGEIIKANIDARVVVMLADADRNAKQLRGEGDAQAAQIYATAFNKNPEFYSFIRSMDAYRASFNSKADVLVVEPDSDFFRYLNRIDGSKK